MKVGFVLPSRVDAPLPSTRVSVLNMLPFLDKAGYEVEILFEPDEETATPNVERHAGRILSRGCDVVIFQKTHGPSVEHLVTQLNNRGVKTLFGVCDVVFPRMAEKTFATLAVTEYLKGLYPAELQRKIYVIHDGIEQPERAKTEYSDHRGSRKRPLRAVLVTSAAPHSLPVLERLPEWLTVSICAAYPGHTLRRLQQVRWQLQTLQWNDRCKFTRFLFDRSIERKAWDAAGVYNDLIRADIGIIPISTEGSQTDGFRPWKVKSENRLTLKMSIGLPVIASPIPSYESVVVSGVNGFLARTREQWTASLEALRDPATRSAIGQRARESVIQRYSMNEQARLLIEVLRSCKSTASDVDQVA
jgi:glycosyltransferase involved in cell wall biosynthesis